MQILTPPPDRVGIWWRVPKLSTNLKEILSHVHGKFEEQFKVLESSMTIINYCIIIINAYYTYIINAQYNYYIANEVFLERCHKQQNYIT